MQNLALFTELFALGLHPIPIKWDVDKKQVAEFGHPEHIKDTKDGIPTIEDVKRWTSNGFKDFNGIALKMLPPFGMFDFDLKNTEKKDCYKEWLQIVAANAPDVLSKVCIETTRSGGYHVYIKYSKLSHKIPVARNPKGDEVISVYTGGLLSYCHPSPHYSIIHNEFQDIAEITEDEFNVMVQAAGLFNECEEYSSGESKVAVIEYPIEYENICLQFDSKCTEDTFEQLLNMIGLYRVKGRFERKKWVPFLREGSAAMYSAKAYMKSKRLLIFSGSFNKFPTWHDSAKTGDNTWSLSPSKIVFYHCNKNWIEAIETIKTIADSAGIDIVEEKPITQRPFIISERLKFPYDIFPQEIQNYIAAHSQIQPEYIANFVLPAVSVALGNSIRLEAMSGYLIKPVLYLACIAYSGGGKSPGMDKAFEPVLQMDNKLYADYKLQNDEYKKLLAAYEKDKKASDKPEKPNMPQMLIKDSTIEKVMNILSVNPYGCCIYADELSGFISRMNQYKSGDDVQKWLELWSGGTVLLQRVTRDETRVEDPFCCITGGIQPGILDLLSKGDNEFNGFYQRFLFAFPDPRIIADWQQVTIQPVIVHDYHSLFNDLFIMRERDKFIYRLSPEANSLYAEWFNYKNIQYNKATNEHARGVISKYKNYCLRFALILQALHDRRTRSGFIEELNMERAIRLTEHYLGMMNKVTKILIPESPADRLQPPYNEFYAALPESFTMKTAYSICETFAIKQASIKTFITRNINKLFKQIERGQYEKMW